MAQTMHILGVRHHGPGSARSVVRALEQINPAVVLIEGPPDADALVGFAGRAEMVPPVAILVHDVEEPAAAVYYPLAEFSPEWQALRWALGRKVPVRFMDLPQWHRMAVDRERWEKFKADAEAAAVAVKPDGEVEGPPPPPRVVEPDPLQRLAEAAGFDDGERWWEHVVEGRRHDGVELFQAVNEAMGELRANETDPRDPDEPYREAWMRRTIRETIAAGADSVAVVCGAWHGPALDLDTHPKKADDELLKGLAKRKTAATWIPWTYDRLAMASGYGAGIRSPGWYDHLWHRNDHLVVESWMATVAGLLRSHDIDCSSAHVIEAVRLSTTLATLRGRPLADLADIGDATRSVFAGADDGPMRLIGRQLLVGDRIGEVPDDAPAVPLQQDLQREQKRLRLKPEAAERTLELDLRTDTDRGRSVLLHRLRLLNVTWGTPADDAARGKGTFRETWKLRWEPNDTVKLIEAGPLGNTIDAAAGAAVARAADSMDLRALTGRLGDAMLADLGVAAAALVRRIEDVAAVATDVALQMATLPPLARLVRYGNVRQTDEGLVRGIIDGLVPRVTAGLGGAVASLNDDAAAEMDAHLRATDAALVQLDAAGHLADWRAALLRVTDAESVHGLIRGRAARLLLDGGRLTTDDVAVRMSRTLSRGTDPGQGARWMEGFLTGSGLLLIHDAKLLSLVNGWVAEIGGEVFEEVLPLLRRTFATFPAAERRQIGQNVKGRGPAVAAAVDVPAAEINADRAARVLPLLVQMLGG